MRIAVPVLLALFLIFAQRAPAQQSGVIDAPGADLNLRADPSTNASVIATVKMGEPFSFQCELDAEWCKVTLASGQSGWMPRDSIRDHFTEEDLPARDEDPQNPSELNTAARRRGFNFDKVVRAAARGETKALKQFFALAEEVDGAAAESYAGVPTTVYHLVGDAKFAAFLRAQPVTYWTMVRSSIGGNSPEIAAYLRRHFPQTAKVVFHREMTDWPSPNGRYAIRKIFSDEFDVTRSKVVRAELVEKESGHVRCDMTVDDIGVGRDREGNVFWSPDSKRFAYLSADLTQSGRSLFSTPRPAPQRKQTTVYQMAGESFAKVDLPLNEVPGRDKDAEVEGAILGHEYTEPIRWAKPDVLILERHEYYEKLKPDTVEGIQFNSVHTFDRLYRIAATMKADGKAAVVWKLRKDR